MTPKEYTFDAAYQPQVRAKRGTREIMLDVIIALLPALCVGVWQFGAQALIPLAVSIVSCVFFEWAYRKLMKKPDSIGDLSAVVTGIILALGRIVGESAALLFTAGSDYKLPKFTGAFGDNLAKLAHKAMESGGTLTIELYLQMQKGQYDNAFGIGCVLIVIVLILNLLTKLAANKLRRE